MKRKKKRGADEENNEMIMTLEEVANYLRVHKMSIYRMCKKGNIPAYKIGNRWRFKKGEVEDWLMKQKSEDSLDGCGCCESYDNLANKDSA